MKGAPNFRENVSIIYEIKKQKLPKIWRHKNEAFCDKKILSKLLNMEEVLLWSGNTLRDIG